MWWNAPLCSFSSRTGSDPNSVVYHCVLRSRSVTVTAMCASDGNSGMAHASSGVRANASGGNLLGVRHSNREPPLEGGRHESRGR